MHAPRFGIDRPKDRHRRPRRAFASAVLLLGLAGPVGPVLAQVQGPESSVLQLESPDFAQREAARAALARAGVAGARAALAGFASAPPSARVLRAQAVRAGGDASLLADVLALAPDPDPRVREELAGYLGGALREHPRPARERLAEACRVLATWAGADPAAAVRAAALEALSRADLDLAADALAELVRTSRGPEGAFSARALANSPRGEGRILALVQASFDSEEARLGDAALALLLAEGYGQALAETEGGGLDARERLPFVRGRLDRSPPVAAASRIAFDAFLGRASFLGATARAERVCALLAGEVGDPVPVLFAGALLSLGKGSAPEHALEPLSRLIARLEPASRADPRGRCDLAIAHTLTAAALVASGKPDAAVGRLEIARALLRGLAAENLERSGSAGARLAAEVAAERAVVELHALLALLRQGKPPDAPAALALARAVHEQSLRAQLLQTVGALESWTGDLDTLAHHPHAPFDLLLSNPELQGRLGAPPIDLSLALGRALAAVVPEELPGLARAEVALPLDDTRAGLLGQIEIARLEQVERELGRLTPDSPQRPELENALRVLSAQLSSQPDVHRVRLPSSLAIELAGDLRDQGRVAEATAICREAKQALERADFLFGGPYVQELIARAESIIGSCLTDAGDPREADVILNQALERLETVTRSGFDDVRAKAVRSNVLVSLAVNANVKLGDPAKALAYFERAFELRQDDFTRTLLACYRARAGRADEARALLREMPESPYNYYNLACTHALLGEPERALDYLARELRPLTKPAGALERQRIWARTDPDLASLRGDPRFRALVGP